MSQLNDIEKRAEMLRLRDFYASRMMPNGPVKIREVGAFRAGFYVGRVIQSIGGTDLSNQSDEEVYALLTREIESSSSPNAGTTSHHCVTHPTSLKSTPSALPQLQTRYQGTGKSCSDQELSRPIRGPPMLLRMR